MELRRDGIRRAIGGQDGQTLHYRDLSPKNRVIAAASLITQTNAAKGYVICSCKRTMLGYRNHRAEAALGAPHKDTLYNYTCRLLLERATNFVADHGKREGIKEPLLRIVMASRKGHHFGQFKAYVMDKLVPQEIAGTTYQDTRRINPDVLRRDLIERLPASSDPGLQLADTLVSAFFQSLETYSPHHADKVALKLTPLMAKRPARYRGWRTCAAGEGVTLYHPTAAKTLTEGQKAFFNAFGYDIAYLASRKPKGRTHFTQAQRMWSHQSPDAPDDTVLSWP